MDPTRPQKLGPHLRILPKELAELPHHPAFDRPENKDTLDSSKTRPSLRTFVYEVLEEAYNFADLRTKTFKSTGRKTSEPADAAVELSHQKITSRELKDLSTEERYFRDEEWFARCSRHVDAARAGTASWEEFKRGLKKWHSENEAEYTPDVYDIHPVLEWVELQGLMIEGYHDIDMRIFEMCHKMPSPLVPRVFSTLVITAYYRTDSFIVAQMPVNLRKLDEAFYSNWRNISEGDELQKRKRALVGTYTSIERCRRIVQEPRATEWMMATASDAKGNLPMFVQKFGVPGAVLKDVGFFIGWTEKRRELQAELGQGNEEVEAGDKGKPTMEDKEKSTEDKGKGKEGQAEGQETPK